MISRRKVASNNSNSKEEEPIRSSCKNQKISKFLLKSKSYRGIKDSHNQTINHEYYRSKELSLVHQGTNSLIIDSKKRRSSTILNECQPLFLPHKNNLKKNQSQKLAEILKKVSFPSQKIKFQKNLKNRKNSNSFRLNLSEKQKLFVSSNRNPISQVKKTIANSHRIKMSEPPNN